MRMSVGRIVSIALHNDYGSVLTMKQCEKLSRDYLGKEYDLIIYTSDMENAELEEIVDQIAQCNSIAQ